MGKKEQYIEYIIFEEMIFWLVYWKTHSNYQQ